MTYRKDRKVNVEKMISEMKRENVVEQTSHDQNILEKLEMMNVPEFIDFLKQYDRPECRFVLVEDFSDGFFADTSYTSEVHLFENEESLESVEAFEARKEAFRKELIAHNQSLDEQKQLTKEREIAELRRLLAKYPDALRQ